MSIKQFNGEWIAREDRIIFRFNTQAHESFSFWLTRVIVRGLIEGANQLGIHRLTQEHPPEVAQVMQDFEKQSAEQGLIFNETYEGGQQQPLGADPILIVGLKMTQQADHTVVEFEMIDQRRITLMMPQPMFMTMILLMQKLQAHAQWALVTTSATQTGAEDTDAPVTAIQWH